MRDWRTWLAASLISGTLTIGLLVVLAVGGWFLYWPVVVVVAIGLVVSVYGGIQALTRLPWRLLRVSEVVVGLLLIGCSLIAGFYHHDLAVGRDELSYTFTAEKLTQTGSLAWEDYLTRPVHGVRLLEGDTFTSQFLPLYPAYLAAWRLIGGGLESLLWANTLLVAVGLLLLALIGRRLGGRWGMLLGVVFFVSQYAFWWFSKRMNVENIALPLIFLGLWLLAEALSRRSRAWALWSIVPMALMMLTRGEGSLFFIWYVVVVVVLIGRWGYRRELHDESRWSWGVPIILNLGIVALFGWYLAEYEAIYIIRQLFDVVEGFTPLLGSWQFIVAAVIAGVVGLIGIWHFRRRHLSLQPVTGWGILLIMATLGLVVWQLARLNQLTWQWYRSQYVIENFFLFGIGILVVVILAGLLTKRFQTGEWWMVVALAPAFLYLIEPNIALDLPWFLRRFYATLIPLFCLLAGVLLGRSLKRWWSVTLVVVLAAGFGLMMNRPVITFVENEGIRDQLAAFAEVLPVDGLTVMGPGWGWQRLAVLEHYWYDRDVIPNIDLLRAAEFQAMLPQLATTFPDWQTDDADLLGIINTRETVAFERFEKLLAQYPGITAVSTESISNRHALFPDDVLEPMGSFTFAYPTLQTESSLTGYVQASPMLNLERIRMIQHALPPQTIVTDPLELFLYRVTDPSRARPIQYVLTPDEQLDPAAVSYRIATPVDIRAFRKEISQELAELTWGVSE